MDTNEMEVGETEQVGVHSPDETPLPESISEDTYEEYKESSNIVKTENQTYDDRSDGSKSKSSSSSSLIVKDLIDEDGAMKGDVIEDEMKEEAQSNNDENNVIEEMNREVEPSNEADKNVTLSPPETVESNNEETNEIKEEEVQNEIVTEGDSRFDDTNSNKEIPTDLFLTPDVQYICETELMKDRDDCTASESGIHQNVSTKEEDDTSELFYTPQITLHYDTNQDNQLEGHTIETPSFGQQHHKSTETSKSSSKASLVINDDDDIAADHHVANINLMMETKNTTSDSVECYDTEFHTMDSCDYEVSVMDNNDIEDDLAVSTENHILLDNTSNLPIQEAYGQEINSPTIENATVDSTPFDVQGECQKNLINELEFSDINVVTDTFDENALSLYSSLAASTQSINLYDKLVPETSSTSSYQPILVNQSRDNDEGHTDQGVTNASASSNSLLCEQQKEKSFNTEKNDELPFISHNSMKNGHSDSNIEDATTAKESDILQNDHINQPSDHNKVEVIITGPEITDPEAAPSINGVLEPDSPLSQDFAKENMEPNMDEVEVSVSLKKDPNSILAQSPEKYKTIGYSHSMSTDFHPSGTSGALSCDLPRKTLRPFNRYATLDGKKHKEARLTFDYATLEKLRQNFCLDFNTTMRDMDDDLKKAENVKLAIVNDDHQYPNSVTPSKIEQSLSNSQYNIPYIDDASFSCRGYYMMEDHRWTRVESRSEVDKEDNVEDEVIKPVSAPQKQAHKKKNGDMTLGSKTLISDKHNESPLTKPKKKNPFLCGILSCIGKDTTASTTPDNNNG